MPSNTNSLPRLELILLTATRTVINTGFRMVYPFLPVLSRGLGIPFETAALAVSGRWLLGLGIPVVGQLADLRGRKTAVMIGMALFALGILVVAIWPTFFGLLLTLVITALGRHLVDPAIQAYVGDRVPYSKRGRAIAIVEMGWSLAFLIGIPIIGWVIAKRGWLAPFPILAIAAAIALLLVLVTIEGDDSQDRGGTSIVKNLRVLFSSKLALAGIAVSFLISAGNETFSIIFGAWMEEGFNLEILALGSATAVIGFADLAGVTLVATITDRLGIRNSLGIGIALTTGAVLLLPTFSTSVGSALLMVFLLYLFFEFSVVSNMTRMTELEPKIRATMMSGLIAGSQLGRGIGAWLGPVLFKSGIWSNCIVAGSLNIIALVIIYRFVRE
jgi:predicted MFS family arabinose efflux permease